MMAASCSTIMGSMVASGGPAGQAALALGSDILGNASPEVGQGFVGEDVEGQHGRAEPEAVLRPALGPRCQAGNEASAVGDHASTCKAASCASIAVMQRIISRVLSIWTANMRASTRRATGADIAASSASRRAQSR